MIKNDRQHKYIKKILLNLKKELEEIKNKYATDRKKIKYLSQGLIKHILQLEREIKEYEDIKKNPFLDSEKITELYKISQTLAKIRILRGITQKQMARKVGCKQSDISRLEREGYCGYTINQLHKLTKALNVEIEMNFIPEEKLVGRKVDPSFDNWTSFKIDDLLFDDASRDKDYFWFMNEIRDNSLLPISFYHAPTTQNYQNLHPNNEEIKRFDEEEDMKILSLA
jgi:transcriptional regulator with XRE-family HTH domain